MKQITLNSATYGLQVLSSWFQRRKILYHGKDLMHRYDTDGHVRKAKHMVRCVVLLSDLYVVM
jgi:hypothetical protein